MIAGAFVAKEWLWHKDPGVSVGFLDMKLLKSNSNEWWQSTIAIAV